MGMYACMCAYALLPDCLQLCVCVCCVCTCMNVCDRVFYGVWICVYVCMCALSMYVCVRM